VLVEHTVRVGNSAVCPEVGQQSELVVLLLCPLLQRERRVDRNTEHLDLIAVVVRILVTELAELTLTHAAEGEGIENQQHRLVTRERRQRDILLVVVLQREVRGDGADFERHRCVSSRVGLALRVKRTAQRRGTSRTPVQPSPRLMVNVWVMPTVGSASAISLGSTCPGCPVFGVSPQIMPLSSSGARASTSASPRSPSAARHHSNTVSMTSSASS